MQAIENYSAEQILTMQDSDYRKLFAKNEDIDNDLRRLGRIWHPDFYAKNADVWNRITQLKEFAEKAKVAAGGDFAEEFATPNGKVFAMRYVKRIDTDFGRVLIGRRDVAYVGDQTHERDFDRNLLPLIRGFQFRNRNQEKLVEGSLPIFHANVSIKDGGRVHLFERQGRVRLSDFLASDRMIWPNQSLAIVSQLLELALYFQEINLSHGGFTANNVWIHPTKGAALLGGWWNGLPFKEIVDTHRDVEGIFGIGEELYRRTVDIRDNMVLANFLDSQFFDYTPQTVTETWRKMIGKTKMPPFEFTSDEFYGA